MSFCKLQLPDVLALNYFILLFIVFVHFLRCSLNLAIIQRWNSVTTKNCKYVDFFSSECSNLDLFNCSNDFSRFKCIHAGNATTRSQSDFVAFVCFFGDILCEFLQRAAVYWFQPLFWMIYNDIWCINWHDIFLDFSTVWSTIDCYFS